MSLMYSKKSIGPRTEPCGTPDVTYVMSDRAQLTDEIVNKTTTILNLCRRNLHICDQHTKVISYKTIIRPHLDYASTAWNPYTARNIDNIESVQRRAARFILRIY